MVSNQLTKPKTEVKGLESELIDDDDKAHVEKMNNYFLIETMEHITKTPMSQQDKEGIRNATANDDQGRLVELCRKVVPEDKRGHFTRILEKIQEEINCYSAVDWIGFVVDGAGGGVAGIVGGAKCGAAAGGPEGIIVGGILGGILVAIIGAYTGIRCARRIAFLCKSLAEVIKSLLKFM